MFPIQSTKAVREVPFSIESVFYLFPVFLGGGCHINWLQDLIDAVTYFIHYGCHCCSSPSKLCVKSPKRIAGS